jgi:hypothetical protein
MNSLRASPKAWVMLLIASLCTTQSAHAALERTVVYITNWAQVSLRCRRGRDL